MFQQTFVPEGHSAKEPLALVVSLTGQAAALAVLVLVPLFVVSPLPNARLRALLIGPAPPVAPPSVPARAPRLNNQTSTRPRLDLPTLPTVLPRIVASTDANVPEVPNVGAADVNASANDSLLQAMGGAEAETTPPPIREKPHGEEHKGPLALGGQVAAANLVHRVEPAYPPLAKTTRVQGTVTFQAIIDTNGRIQNLQLVSGHPLLVKAAKEAILEWRYRPTMLNGKAVEVLTTITVRFALSQ
jgi:periplasmic protein TonB